MARPSAHGQAMMRTATAAVNASRAVARGDQPAREGGEREHEHDRHEDGRDPVGEALRGRLACLSLLHEPGDLRDGGLRADPRRPDDEPAPGVEGAADDLGPGRDVDRHGLSGQQRLVDGGLAFEHDPVGEDLPARLDLEDVPDGESASLLRAGLEERADRGPRAPARAGLEVAAEEDERRDDGAHLEVEVGAVEEEERDERPAPGRERADRDERVHAGRAVARAERGRPVEGPARDEDDGRRERGRDPLPARELQALGHREDEERER